MSDLYVNAGDQATQTIVTRGGAGGDSGKDSLALNLFFKFYIGLMVVVGLTVVGAAGWSAYYVSNYGFLSLDVAGLVDDIEHGDRETAQTAAGGLAEDGSLYREAVPLLAAIVADPRSPNRDIAAIALGEIGPAAYPAVPDLIAALESPDEKLQIAAITALGQIGEDAVAATLPLAGILENGDAEQRGLAARALAGIGRSTPKRRCIRRWTIRTRAFGPTPWRRCWTSTPNYRSTR